MPKLSEARFLLRLSQIRLSEDPEYKRRELEGALKDLIQETPLQTFSPGVVDVLSVLLPGVDRGATAKEWGKHIGDLAGDRAKDMFERLNKSQKALVIIGAVAMTTGIAFQGGTRDLRRLGLEPSVSLRLPYEVKLRASVDAEPQLRDAQFHASLSRDFAIDETQRARLRVGDQFVSAGYGIDRFNLSGSMEARYHYETGRTEIWGSAVYARDQLRAAISGSFDSQGDTRLTLGVYYAF